jgi:hypothetical protein
MTKRRTVVLLALAVVALASARLLRAQEKENLLDTQKIVMENMVVRVIEVRVAPGVAEVAHSHGRGLTSR